MLKPYFLALIAGCSLGTVPGVLMIATARDPSTSVSTYRPGERIVSYRAPKVRIKTKKLPSLKLDEEDVTASWETSLEDDLHAESVDERKLAARRYSMAQDPRFVDRYLIQTAQAQN